MYIIRSETFIEIDLLQHLKISRQTYPTNLSKISFSLNLSHLSECKTLTILTNRNISLIPNLSIIYHIVVAK